MTMPSKVSHLLSITVALLLCTSPSWAVTETDASVNLTTDPGGDETAFDGDVVGNSTNLLYDQPISAVYANPSSGVDSNPIGADYPGFSLSGINDGVASNSASNDTVFFNGDLGGNQLAYDPVVTIDLNTAANPAGYTLNEIQTINGWQNYDQSWSDQSYSVYYSTVSAPTTFALLATVDYHPYDNDADNPGDHDIPVSSEVTLSNLAGATGVAALQFDLSPSYDSQGGDISGGALIREFQAFGDPTEAPEPSTYAMMLGGLALLGLCLRHKLA